MPESAYGPTNQCVGIGYRLLKAGHRVVFAAEASWDGKLKALGFEEDLVNLAPPAPADSDADPGQFWTDYIRDTSQNFVNQLLNNLKHLSNQHGKLSSMAQCIANHNFATLLSA